MRGGSKTCKTKIRIIMSDDQRQFLSLLGQPPARFTVEQTAIVLNFQDYEILALVTLRILKPIGSPAKNATKFFIALDVLDLAKDKTWLTKATNALYQLRNKKNNLQKSRRVNAAQTSFLPIEFESANGR